MYYDMEGNEITQERWIVGLGADGRGIGSDEIGDASVSTVYLGLDHNHGDGPPLIFETMVFGGRHDQYQERYSTREEALQGHRRAVSMVRGELGIGT